MANDIQLNVGDNWQAAASIQINISDVWKEVQSIQIKIGEVWKTAWKKKAAYFKIQVRAKAVAEADLRVGVSIGLSAIATEDIAMNGTFTNHVTSAIVVGAQAWREDELALLMVSYESLSAELYTISEIEVNIYDNADVLIATAKPDGDNTVRWDTTGTDHYTEVDQGVDTPDDAKYVSTNVAEVELLNCESPSW